MSDTFLLAAGPLGKSVRHFVVTCRALACTCLGLCLLAGGRVVLAAQESTIKLKSGATVSGRILRSNSDGLILLLQPDQVASVDGAALPTPVVEGARAPAFTATDLDGATQALPSSPPRVTLLQFWATWCPHCRSDLALIQDLHSRYHGQGLRVLGISIDQDVAKLRAFVRQKPMPYPVIADVEQAQRTGAAVSELYQAEGVPAYFLVDAQGVIRRAFAGSVTEGGRVDLEGAVRQLVSSDGTTPRAGDARRR